MKRTIEVVLLSLAITITQATYVATAEDLTFIANIRPGVSVRIHADVLENQYAPVHGRTILCIHGLAHAGNAFLPLTAQVFADPLLGTSVRRVILLNMPGRGGSGLPSGALFGDLNVDDYATIVIRTLEKAKKQGISPNVIVGHSMGGLIIQVAQERLLSRQTSLNARFGVSKINVMGSASPMEVLDPFLESGAGLYILSLYTHSNASLGQFVMVSPTDFLGLFFTDFNQQVVPGAPTPGQVVAFGYKANEAIAAAVQTVGTADMRPSVRAGAFAPANGSQLRVIVGSQDIFSDTSQQRSLYEYLTGDASDVEFHVITASDAVHDQFISNPGAIVTVLDL